MFFTEHSPKREGGWKPPTASPHLQGYCDLQTYLASESPLAGTITGLGTFFRKKECRPAQARGRWLDDLQANTMLNQSKGTLRLHYVKDDL